MAKKKKAAAPVYTFTAKVEIQIEIEEADLLAFMTAWGGKRLEKKVDVLGQIEDDLEDTLCYLIEGQTGASFKIRPGVSATVKGDTPDWFMKARARAIFERDSA